MHEYEIKVLTLLSGKKEAKMDDLEASLGIGKDAMLWTIQSLSEGKAVTVKRSSVLNAALSKEGEGYLGQFPEEALVKKIMESGGKIGLPGIKDQIGLSWAKRNGWITLDKSNAVLTAAGEAVAKGGADYGIRAVLNGVKGGSSAKLQSMMKQNKDAIDALVKRGLVEIKEKSVIDSIAITEAGKELLGSGGEKGIGMLTKEIIANETWKGTGFRKYDINAPVEKQYPARLHPVREFINTVRQKWLEMGFVEVSGPIVETAFWNFDALFSPQDHPTREMQDTFFLRNPKELTINDLEVLERVRKMHTSSWKEKWSEEIAKEAVLRTHTTSVSAHYIRSLAQTLNSNYPLRLFSVGSVFRNESIDYKHLAELHQYDGIIVGNNLSLAHLIDTLKKFYAKLGFENVKLRPSYFPFTEPSLEAFYYDEEHGDSIELTGGGIIRKEITKAMGIDKTVLAWGGGIERLMINSRIFGLDSILTPYKNNVGWLRSRQNLKV